MFTWLFALLTLLGTLAWTPLAHACKCAAPDAPAAALQSAQAVFEGEVVAIDEHDSDLLVSLRVPRAWKGIDSAEQVRVRTRRESAACGYPFSLGETYLIYAEPAQPAQGDVALSVARCGRTRPISEAHDDLLALGLGSIPVSSTAEGEVLEDEKTNVVERRRDQPAAGGCASCSLGAQRTSRTGPAAAAAWLALGAGLVLRLQRRRS
jgi:hypothetical protein